ncbi:MAG: putative cysteine desulfurase [Tenericutes bacterium ADurb.Bin239]|nr:MAG: putative cysteine desulfurase [Tenericutes bacterium ADurb.Bin239]
MYDVYKIRKDFPVFLNNKTVYLDNAATTYKPQVVIDAVTDYLSKETANSGRGDYRDAYLVDKRVDETRILVKKFINSKYAEEIVFTQGTTASLNMIAVCYGEKFLKANDEILISIAEHSSNTLPWVEVARKTGAKIIYMPLTEDGLITPKLVKEHMTKKTKIVSLVHVSNVLGYVNDVKKIAKVVHDMGAIIVVDGAQSVPHLPVDVQDMNIDFLAFSGHKMLAPTGIGILYGKKHLLEKMDPYQMGGGMNISYDKEGNYELFKVPHRFEAGTLNIEAIYGLHAAIEYLNKIGMDNIAKHEHKLRRYAVAKLKEMDHVILYNENAETGIITFNIKGVFSQDIATYLNSKNVAVRSGQHCAKFIKEYIGEIGTVRASLYLYTTKEEIDTFLKAVETSENYLDAYF